MTACAEKGKLWVMDGAGGRVRASPWTTYWSKGRPTPDIYGNDGRVFEHARGDDSVAGARILEVGAGTGRDSVALVRAGAVGVVVDLAMEALVRAREAAQAKGVHLHLIRADACSLPFREGSFDVVFHQGLIEHFRDPAPILRENRRVLADEGMLLVDVPQRYHYWTLVKKPLIAMGRWFAGWETEYSPRELERLVEGQGFRLVRSYGDWMRPTLAYRVLWKALARAGVRVLPMYPRGPVWWERVWHRLRGVLLRQRWALYTCFCIGVVARKPGVGPEAGG